MNQPSSKSDIPKSYIHPVRFDSPNPIRKAVAWLVNTLLQWITGILCRVDADELKRIPSRGPLILIGNHVNFLEVPVLITRVRPRPIVGFSKLETWYNPFKAVLFNLWGGIPIRRGELDVKAIRTAEEAIAKGKIFVISPEGTRSKNGKLQVGHPGTVLLAARSGAPVLPLVFYGSEYFWQNLKKLKRTDFHVRVGNPFMVDTRGKALSREVRNQAIREIMYQMAALLPPQNRGEYADLENATEEYLRFAPGVASNLQRARETIGK